MNERKVSKQEQKARQALHKIRGKPVLYLEFEVFQNGKVSMWTHFEHSKPFSQAYEEMLAIKNHLDTFIEERGMCPFNPHQEDV